MEGGHVSRKQTQTRCRKSFIHILLRGKGRKGEGKGRKGRERERKEGVGVVERG